MAERWRTRVVELLADAGRALLVVGLCWIGADMARAQTPTDFSAQSAAQTVRAAPHYTGVGRGEVNTIASRMFNNVSTNEPCR